MSNTVIIPVSRPHNLLLYEGAQMCHLRQNNCIIELEIW